MSVRRATLIVGYGAFGRRVLERLLASAAPRGVLEWEEPAAGAGAGERRLRDLALIEVGDRIALGTEEGTEPSASGAAGILGDLYRQIEVLEPRASAGQDLAAAAAETAGRLLSASARSGRDDALPLGLDVVVLARPDEPEVLGVLDPMAAAAMDALANNANLTRAVEGAQPLSFVEVLDFESYWDDSEAGRRLRRAVAGSLEGWQHRRAAGRPSFGRVYLVDGRTADGIRDSRHRIDEVALFLELLLFEGQRGGELQALWQPRGPRESPLATFGVRSMERSAGLLSRLAAARFGVGWLDDLAGEETAGGPVIDGSALTDGALDALLAPFTAAGLEELIGAARLRALLAERLRELEGELLELWRGEPERPEKVVARYREAARGLSAELAAEARAAMETAHRERLAHLRESLEEAVSSELHHPRRALPVGTVIRRLEAFAAELAAREEAASGSGGAAEGSAADAERPAPDPAPGAARVDRGPARARLERLAGRYRRFRRRRAAPAELRSWWPLWAAALSVGLVPVLGGLLAEVPPPDATDFLLAKAYLVLTWIARPAVLGCLLFAALWGLGAGLFQRRIEAVQERAEAFYLDPHRGRLADGLRAELGPDGGLGAPLHGELEGLLDDLAQAVRGELERELERALERLRERRRELLWLRDELRDFLVLHGCDPAGDPRQRDRLRRDGTGVRRSVERAADLERLLAHHPPSRERFRSAQAELRPFDGWQERYAEGFLHPLLFLDRLCRLYDQAPVDDTLADPVPDALDFLEHAGSFDLAFAWKAQEGVPVDRRYALLPAAWHRSAEVRSRLAELRISEDRVLTGPDPARAYLLRFQSGISPACLEAAADSISAPVSAPVSAPLEGGGEP